MSTFQQPDGITLWYNAIVMSHSTPQQPSDNTATSHQALLFLFAAALLLAGLERLADFEGSPECLDGGGGLHHQRHLSLRRLSLLPRHAAFLHDLLVLGLQCLESLLQLMELLLLLCVYQVYLLILTLSNRIF